MTPSLKLQRSQTSRPWTAWWLVLVLLALTHCSAGSALGPTNLDDVARDGEPGPNAIGAVLGDNQATTDVPLDFGENVLVFDPSMSKADMQAKLDQVYNQQASNQFGNQRIAYLFRPGAYALDVQMGFYMTAAGLGRSPDDVNITGAIRSKASWFNGNATQNFWRGAENMAVTPTQDNGVNVWAVSQATHFRRMHVRGKLALSDNGYSSGGFIADSAIDSSIDSGTQQQFLTRNSDMSLWIGGSWNMVFVGDTGTPSGAWPAQPYTTVAQTPTLREKPYLAVNDQNNFVVVIPSLKQKLSGTSWKGGTDADGARELAINHFYIAHADKDSSATLNQALSKGLNLLFTPGIYKLSDTVHVTRPNTTLLGLGLATLTPQSGQTALLIDDVSGVSVAGLLLDAGADESPSLLQLGKPGDTADHSANPTALFDVACRVGGAAAGSAKSCVTIHSNDVLIDNIWLWRADHGNGVGWETNPSDNGITVNGRNVTAYGLFVEHFQGYQTLWNGENGNVYFYQSEIPYDVPDQGSWQNGKSKGFASYKVGDNVASHNAIGMGVYCVFTNNVTLDTAIETPTTSGVKMSHLLTEWLGSAANSAISHIINSTGSAVNSGNRQAKTDT